MYRIVLADDHTLFRKGLKGILTESTDLEVVAEAGDGLDLLRLLDSALPDMVILDISMPNMRGIEALCEIKRKHPGAKVLILTMHNDREYLHQSITAGADGYLLKDDTDPDLFAAIEKIRHGRVFISPRLAEDMVEDWAQMKQGSTSSTGEKALTPREREILKLVAEGRSSGEIADLLFISARTVEHHRAGIMRKLKINKTTDLVKYALQKGYI